MAHCKNWKRFCRSNLGLPAYLEFLEGRELLSVAAPEVLTQAFDAALPATHLVVTTVPARVVAGVPIGPTVTVKLEDSRNNLVTGDTSSVSISLVATNGATLGGTTNVQVINGMATFSDLAVGKAGTYSLRATDAEGGLRSVTSGKFLVTAETSSSQLVIVQGTADTPVGMPLKPTLTIDVEDRFGNVITTDHSRVTLAIVGGPTTGTFSGLTTVTAKKGVASFPTLGVTAAGFFTTTASDAALVNNTQVQFSLSIDLAVITAAAPHPLPAYTFGQTINLSTTFKTDALASIPFADVAEIHDGNGNLLGTAPVGAKGLVKFTLPTVTGGAAQIAAGTYANCVVTYPGDDNHAPFTSNTFTLLIKHAATQTTLQTSSTQLTSGESLTLTASVGSVAAPSVPRTGLMTFLDNGSAFGTVTLSGTSAALTFVPTPGVHKYTAMYGGDVDFLGSGSGAAKVVTDFLAPASLSGGSVILEGLTGTGSVNLPSLDEIDVALSGKNVTDEDIAHQHSNPGTYTYKRTGPTTATLAVVTHSNGQTTTVTGQLTFLTTGSATLQLKSGTDQAVLFTPPLTQIAPPDIVGGVLTLTATNGTGTVGSTGVVQLATSGGTDHSYTQVSVSGPTVNSTGTYIYTQNSPPAANITYSDIVVGTGRIWLFYTSANGGFYSNLSQHSGWQTGTFTFTPPPVG